MEEAYGRIERLRALVDCFVQVDGGVKQDNVEQVHDAGADLLVVGSGDLRARGPGPGLPRLGTSPGMSLQRALELADEAQRQGAIRSRRSAPSSSRETRSSARARPRPRGRHGEVVALEAAGERARGATLYVTMEPCAHHGTTPPCVDAVLAAGIARVVAGSRDPNPEAGGGLERLEAAGVEVELADSVEARRQNEAWRTWVAQGRPFVTYKAAITLDGRVTVPGLALGLGEESRRLVHELRAASDAVAVGMGTVRLENPRLDARDVGATRQPRRLAFGTGPLPDGSELELRIRAARGGAPRARRRGRPVAPARGRADARGRLPPRRPRRQAPALRRADALRLRAGPRRPARRAAHARPPDDQAGRRGRPARGVPPRAVTFEHVHRARARGGGGRVVRGRPARRRVRHRRRGRRLGRDRGRLPDGRRERRRAARLRRRAGDARRARSRSPGASTSSPRSAPATRSAATRSRVTSTASAGSPRSSPDGTAFASGSRRRAELLRYCVEKGSITVDGVSLTVAESTRRRSRSR